MKLFVSDIAPIEKETNRYYNEAGYLVLPKCKIACSGVLQYSNVTGQDGEAICDGELINVLRPKKALRDCVQQFANLPVTLEHPEGDEVNPDNAKELVVGTLGSNPEWVIEDGVLYIVNDIIVYDKEAQKKIESDEFAELSAGYSTAFRRKSGIENGEVYDAEQFVLEPNHVALVERGRCGSKCRVCDHIENNEKKGNHMSKKRKTAQFKYFLQVGDSDEMIELTEEQANALANEDGVEFEELDEDDVEFEEVDEDDIDVPGIEDDEEIVEDEDEDIEEDDEEIVEDEDEDIEEDDEEIVEDEDIEEDDEDETAEEDIYTVRFDDGTVGKMDANAYEHCKRWLEMSKKGDSASKDGLAKTLLLTHRATEVLGEKFDLNKFVVGDSVNVAAIKKAVVSKVMPNIELKGVKGDSLERLYDMAYRTHKKNKKEYAKDMQDVSLMSAPVADTSVKNSVVGRNRQAYLNRLNGKKEGDK